MLPSQVALLIVIAFCSSIVASEKHQFLATPAVRQLIATSSNVTINCTTNDANATTAVFYKKRKQPTWKRLAPGVDQIVVISNQVYALVKVRPEQGGNYQCRAWKNGAVIAWPPNAGRIIVFTGKKKNKKGKVIASKKDLKLKAVKFQKRKNAKKRKGKKKKNGKKRKGSKKGGKKGRKDKKNKKTNNKKTTPKVDLIKNVKKSILKELKTRKTKINIKAGDPLHINCAARYFPSVTRPVITIHWYKDGKQISDKLFTTKHKQAKRKVLSFLSFKGFDATRDQGKYQCKAVDSNGKLLKEIEIEVALKP